jgi:hypothetical protein
MKKTVPAKVLPSPPLVRLAPSHGEIAVRAEALWRHKGCPAGCDNEIWLEAEQQWLMGDNSPRSFDSDSIMAELEGRFPGSGSATTSL